MFNRCLSPIVREVDMELNNSIGITSPGDVGQGVAMVL
jgi:hypothetical protein